MTSQHQEPHRVPGQINICVLDKDSSITSRGKHNRLLVFYDRSAGTIEIREDDIGLPTATEEDRQRVACRSYQRMHPKGSRLAFLRSEQSPTGKSVWHYYRIDGGRLTTA